MRNTLGDLNNHLFMQLERLNDEDLKGDALKEEITRSEAITKLSARIIENGALVLRAKVASEERLRVDEKAPKMLDGGE